jgi:ATP phosphoribosyltransferase regulatory subunit
MRVLAHYALSDAARERLDRISAEVIGCFTQGGYRRIALPVLQPADLYLDMAGEDIRERMFVLDDPAGAELCLRADLTIPVCRSVLDDPSAVRPARLCCLGPIFRFEIAGESSPPTELLQAGIESLGDPDRLVADTEILGLARRALERAGAGPLAVELGDVALFPALLADLAIDDVWVRRLAYAFRHPSLLRPTLNALHAGVRPPAGTFEIDFSTADHGAAEGFVREKLGLGGDELAFGRTAREIAAHLIDKALAAKAPLPQQRQLDLVESFLAVAAATAEGLVRLKSLSAGASFARALAEFEIRIERTRAQLRDGDVLNLSTTLGRNFVYYTGFVFDLLAPGLAEPLASGGRYDRLMSDLGAAEPVPAVGGAVWPERLLAAGAAGARNGI